MSFQRLRSYLAMSALILFLGSPAFGSLEPRAQGLLPDSVPGCVCEEEIAELRDFQERIAAAPSLEEAVDLATSRTRMARKALAKARWIAPRSESIDAAHTRLADYEARLADVTTTEEAAWEFGELVQLASLSTGVLSDVEIDVDDGGCDFSGGEIIAIVLGFIFGIIPGIILLILLC